jgi:putative hydrolase of the HAD superfamily
VADLKRAGIIFDFDDTLVYSHEQFLLTEQAFLARMAELGLYDDDLLSAARARDIDNVRQAGYMAAECFPMALAQTYESYCGKYGCIPDDNETRQLLLLGWQPYTSLPRDVEGARELLRRLRAPRGAKQMTVGAKQMTEGAKQMTEGAKRLLILFTQGEQEIQQQRLSLCALDHMFDIIKIVRQKNDAALKALLQEHQLEPALTWTVGNSLRADINPAIRAGLNAVHLTTAGWSYEDEEPCGFYHSISHLRQFADLLRHEEAAQ